ncbi:NADP-dependent succinic semialdehyde dehydrogenase [Nostoc sp. 3335mG]|nr:NADP-dependent succinic semialdehyde dehydrogenase [Nostoc sp. 3335mG]
MMQSINPANGQLVGEYAIHSPAEVDAILSGAAAAQAHWRRSEVTQRSELLIAIARQLRADKAELASIITAEMGKPLAEAEAEVEKCALNCDHYAEAGPGFIADAPVKGVQGVSLAYDPLGVVLAIMPWNYPLWQVFRFVAPALMAGNGIILKHAANVCGCAEAIGRTLLKAGAPKGLFGHLLIESGRVQAVIEDERIAAVTLTGSTEVGMIVAAQAGRVLKKQVLELGGSDPFVVLADANLEQAARVAVTARFTNAGQSCVNAKRFIVEASVADAFVEAFRAEVAKLVLGDPLERATTIGPMARANLRAALDDQVQRSIAAGARLLAGGQATDRPGFFYEPTLLDGVQPGMAAFDEETFGPAAAIIRAADVDQAIGLANRTVFGLGASLWTSDLDRAGKLVRQIDAGAVFVNAMVASDPRVPFGGIKQSGYGRELGDLGLREFTNIKTVKMLAPEGQAA